MVHFGGRHSFGELSVDPDSPYKTALPIRARPEPLKVSYCLFSPIATAIDKGGAGYMIEQAVEVVIHRPIDRLGEFARRIASRHHEGLCLDDIVRADDAKTWQLAALGLVNEIGTGIGRVPDIEGHRRRIGPQQVGEEKAGVDRRIVDGNVELVRAVA